MRCGLLILCVVFALGMVGCDCQRRVDDVKAGGEKLLAWGRKQGVIMPKLGFHYGDNASVTMVATSKIKAGETSLAIPGKLALCHTIAEETFSEESLDQIRTALPDLSQIIEDHHQLQPALLALSLLVEAARGKDSFWRETIDMLPRLPVAVHEATHKDVDMVFEGMDQFMHTRMSREVTEASLRQDALLHFASTFVNASYLPQFSPTAQDIQWADSMVMARSFRLPATNEEIGDKDFRSFKLPAHDDEHKDLNASSPMKTCLLPLVDMLNHVEKGSSLTGTGLPYKILPNTDLEPGDEMLLEYLPDGSLHTMFMDFGFVIEGLAPPNAGLQQIQELMEHRVSKKVVGVHAKELFSDMDCDLDQPQQGSFEAALEAWMLPCARVVMLTAHHEAYLVNEVTKSRFPEVSIPDRNDLPVDIVESMAGRLRHPLNRGNEFAALDMLHSINKAHTALHDHWNDVYWARQLKKSDRRPIVALMSIRRHIEDYFKSAVDVLKERLTPAAIEAALATKRWSATDLRMGDSEKEL